MNYEKLLHRFRNHPDLWELPSDARFFRVMEKVKVRMLAQREASMTPSERDERTTRRILAANPHLTRLDLL